MLNPAMSDLIKIVGNRYLLVNLAAQRARDISVEADEMGIILPEKPVKMALDEIVAGKIRYCPGPKVEHPDIPVTAAELAGTLDLDLDDEVEELAQESDQEQNNDRDEEEILKEENVRAERLFEDEEL
jgi:DNA-directed RNA polymerase omega subunit